MGSHSLNARSLWYLTLERLQPKVDPSAFEMWLQRPVDCSIDGDVLLVFGTSKYVADTLERRFGSAVRFSLQEVLGYPMDVQFLTQRQVPNSVIDPLAQGDSADVLGEIYVGHEEGEETSEEREHVISDVPPDTRHNQATLALDQFFLSSEYQGELRLKTFDTFFEDAPGVQQAMIEAMEFILDASGSLLLVGPKETGKTHLAAAVAWACLERGICQEVFFTQATDLFSLLQSFFHATKSDAYNALFQRIRDADLLVLDNVMHPSRSSGKSTWFDEVLYLLLSRRLETGRMTVVTARPENLLNLDSGLVSRLSDPSCVRAAVVQHV